MNRRSFFTQLASGACRVGAVLFLSGCEDQLSHDEFMAKVAKAQEEMDAPLYQGWLKLHDVKLTYAEWRALRESKMLPEQVEIRRARAAAPALIK